jgi:hypothetical protein
MTCISRAAERGFEVKRRAWGRVHDTPAVGWQLSATSFSVCSARAETAGYRVSMHWALEEFLDLDYDQNDIT